ncbi:MAG: CRTAC1 family protein [Acidobacteriota bacterium]
MLGLTEPGTTLSRATGAMDAASHASALPAEEEWFTDAAREAGIDFTHFNGMSGGFYISEIMGAGGALFDLDSDGDLDIYFVQGQMLGHGKPQASIPPHRLPLRDRLYRNDLVVRADGSRSLRFTDISDGSGLVGRAYGMGVAAGDFDNDGRVDLYRTALGPNQLFRNNGDGTFTDVTHRTGTGDARWSVSASFVDFDRDGWLDLYVGNYVDHSVDDGIRCSTRTGKRDYCGPRSYTPVPDRLYRNRRDGTFVDVTAEAQVSREHGPALGVVAADFNADGWADIYVANDGEPNFLWINERNGRFKNTALLAGAALNSFGSAEGSMGVDAGDFDNDGDEDLFVTNLPGETNTLYVNDGSGVFEDRTTLAGLAIPSLSSTGFGTGWFDFDNDGWLDLLVANGAVRIVESAARAADPSPLHERNQLFRNVGGGRYQEVSARAGAVFELAEVSRGAAFGDVDNDGDVDVLITNNNGPARLLINRVGQRNRWVGLRVIGGSASLTADPGPGRRVGGQGRDMVGARVGVFRDLGPPLWRRARADGSYASANDPRVLVGLGEATSVQRVRVIWPSGRVEEWKDISVGQWMTLREGTGVRASPGGL